MPPKSLVPKQRTLTESENQTTFEAWRECMIFHISLDDKSARFLSSGDLKSWTTAEGRGFTDDGADHTNQATKMNAATKASLLGYILGSISSYAPVISHRFVKHQATSLECIWDRLRSHYGLRKTGARVLELMDFKLELNESRECLWERLYSYMEDNLLTKDGGVLHEGVKLEHDEQFTPTLLNVLVTCWLNIINPALPTLVRQRFTTQLRSNSVFSIREEISDSIPTLLAEMEERDSCIGRSSGFQKSKNFRSKNYQSNFKNKRNCCLCETAGRQSNHFLSMCPYLPAEDKKFMSKTREILALESDNDSEEDTIDCSGKHHDMSSRRVDVLSSDDDTPSARRVDVVGSPMLEVSVKGKTAVMIKDCGAEANLITEKECKRLNIEILPTRQRAKMADGKTQLDIIGEAHFIAKRDHHSLKFGGLVVRQLDSPILAGMPFLLQNDISINYSTNTIYLGQCCKVQYDSVKKHPMSHSSSVLRVSNQTCILPGENISFQLPKELQSEENIAVEPRTTVPPDMPKWVSCGILTPDQNGCITLTNTSEEPVVISKHTQICQVRPTTSISKQVNSNSYPPNEKPKIKSTYNNLNTITVDPSQVLSIEERKMFHNSHKKYKSVFSPEIGCYNGYSGKFSHIINMSSKLPPSRKGRIPIYSRGDMQILQDKFDELLEAGVLVRAEDIGVPIEYVHPSFLVKKSSGGHRLVTSFGEVAEYAKPQPTITSNIEHVLLQLGQWKYIVKTDLKSAYYQIPLSPESSKFVGVMTPYKGSLVYQRSIMGLPGSEAALEEVLSRIFGDIIKEGNMIKLADDLYIGSNTVECLVAIWEEVLKRLYLNGLRLSPDKTICCPTSTTILGWHWENGFIKPSSHRINALSACDPPQTVKSLRSYIGCFKFLSRVLPCYSEVLQPLEEYCGGKDSTEKISWSDDLIKVFNQSKNHLKKAKPVVLPRYDDQLHIITDASNLGIGSSLFVVRQDKPILAGYFNAALKAGQERAFPCELEALCIAASIKHYAYYISQSHNRTRILTDSRPCVLAYKKLKRGEFSSSPKVTTFLSLASRYGVEILHIAGYKNIFSDYLSRNPIQCKEDNCQICRFIKNTSTCTVGEIKVSDILSGESKVPFTTRKSWIPIQKACPNLNKVYKYLSAGASIPKKKKNLTDVRRYISHGVTLSQKEDLIVVNQPVPFKSCLQRIVVPRDIADGLLTALHVQLNHPSAHQLKQVFCRAYFCLDLDSKVRDIVNGCHTCAALKKIPSLYHEQSTSPPSESVGGKFSVDVIRRYSQFILMIREDISSFTEAVIIKDEKADTLREATMLLVSRMRSPFSPKAVLRTDPSTSFRALLNDDHLSKMNLQIEIGEAKNVNKNPIAEKGVQELETEILKLKPSGGQITAFELARAVCNLNSLIRHNKLSAFEMWTMRDMTTGKQLTVKDHDLIHQKQAQREKHHHASAKFKARGKDKQPVPEVKVGDIVYIYIDGSKIRLRDKYLITKIEEKDIYVQKLVNNQLRKWVYKLKDSDIIKVIQNSTKSKIVKSPKSKAKMNLQVSDTSDDSEEESESPVDVNPRELEAEPVDDEETSGESDESQANQEPPEPLMGAQGQYWCNVDPRNVIQGGRRDAVEDRGSSKN